MFRFNSGESIPDMEFGRTVTRSWKLCFVSGKREEAGGKKKKKKGGILEYNAGRGFLLHEAEKRLGKRSDGNPLTDDIASATSGNSRTKGVVASTGRALVRKGLHLKSGIYMSSELGGGFGHDLWIREQGLVDRVYEKMRDYKLSGLVWVEFSTNSNG